MKKLLISLMIAGLLMFGSGNVDAGGFGNSLDINLDAGNSGHSVTVDGGFYPMAGLAGGGGSFFGNVEGGASGFIFNGTITANAPQGTTPDSYGGGNSTTIRTPGIGTDTLNHAEAGAFLDLTASTPSWGFGGVAGGASGQVEQSSLNTGGGIDWNGGVTGGIAAQESSGEFQGTAVVGVVFCLGGTAGFDAEIDMVGGSMTNSYILSGDGKGLGTQVGAGTSVVTTGGSYDTGLGYASVEGGFSASGMVRTSTSQNVNGGYANASANGSYSGAGSLGSTYNGSAVGYSQTFAGNNGTMYSGAGMSVTSTLSPTVD